MNYLIVTYDEYRNMPYIKNYVDQINTERDHYDIVLWNRSGQDKEPEYGIVFHAKAGASKLGKLLPFLRWRRFVCRLLKRGKYDRLIVITTLPAVLLADRLLKEYRFRFWLDVRDYTYEGFAFYKRLVGHLSKNAAGVSISSAAFQSFLPDDAKLYLTNNLTNAAFEKEHCSLDVDSTSIVIGYVGGIQYFEQNKELLRQLHGSRYLLKYVGKLHPGCDLREYCRNRGIDNVEFQPAFYNVEKPRIYEHIDIINSVYGADSPIVRLALPNKLYDCALFKIPILVSRGTYLAKLVDDYSLGLAVDLKTEKVDECLDRYLRAFDKDKFERGCRAFLKMAREEDIEYRAAVTRFCAGGADL